MRLLLMLMLLSIGNFHKTTANPDAKRLYSDLLQHGEYNNLIRPVANSTKPVTVYLGLKLSQLIDVDEKNQIMTTNVWLRLGWREPRLSWDPAKYGGIRNLRVPADSLWLPDIVMFNNADGNYEVNLMTKASLHSEGKVFWEPPAIYKSSCQIDVEFFPFDKQKCSMKFGSWTYDGLQVDLKHMQQLQPHIESHIPMGIDLEGFYESTEWDLLGVPAERNERRYPCCPEPYPDITFSIVLRRKTLFYSVNLIIPCVAISLLTVMVFYLPSESGEKTTLCISVLLALTVFFLLLAETIPPTSLVVPLIGKYLLFTMVLVTLSIILTVVVLNVHYRKASTHRMSPWIRKLFLQLLPKLLRFGSDHSVRSSSSKAKASSSQSFNTASSYRQQQQLQQQQQQQEFSSSLRFGHAGYEWNNRSDDFLFSSADSAAVAAANARIQHANNSQDTAANSLSTLEDNVFDFVNGGGASLSQIRRQTRRDLEQLLVDPDANSCDTWQLRSDCKDDLANGVAMQNAVAAAVDGVYFIAQNLQRESEDDETVEDWMFVAMVMDRLFLWVFSIACVIGTMGIILQAPSLYDQQPPINLNNLTVRSQFAMIKAI